LGNKENIGLLGLGSFTTQLYIRLFNQMYNKRHGGYSTCPLVMLNANFDHINPFLPDKFDQLVPVMEKYINRIGKFDLRALVLPNITLHETIDKLSLPEGTNLIHPVLETIKSLMSNGVQEVFLFGTRYTMNASYMTNLMTSQGINVSIPNVEDQILIDQLRQDIYLGKNDGARQLEFVRLIREYSETAPVVLACTELSLIELDGMERLFDMVKIQVRQAIKHLD